MKSFIICLLTVLFFFNSCRELVTDEFPDFAAVPVVNSILREGEPLEMRLSWTAKIDSSRLKFIENATVRLFANDEYIETLTHWKKGIYKASVNVVSSVKYSCEINIPEYETVIATDMLPTASVPSDIQVISVAWRDEEGIAYPAIRFTFENNPAERRYYEAIIWEVKNNGTHNAVKTQMPIAHFTDPVLKSEGLPVAVFSNENIKENEYTMTVNFLSHRLIGDGQYWLYEPVMLELRSVSYDYYRYEKQKYLYEIGFAPEFGKPSPVFSLYSNINNGYGIFAGYATVFSDTLDVKVPYN